MLRDYQERALTQLRNLYSQGIRRVLLHMPTGAGKTVIFCDLLKSVLEKGKSAVMIVRGRKLVDQASNRLFREGVPHGVMMAKHWNYKPWERIQICSIDTLRARSLYPKADIVVIDEAHLFTSKGDQDYLKNYTEPLFLPVTATPYGPKGLGHVADTVIHPISMKELIEQGHLVPPRYYCPSIPDLSKVKLQGGDYKSKDLEKIMQQKAIVGDIIEHWLEIGNNEPTLCFAISVDHSKYLVKEFIKNGIKAEHCDANSSDAERNAAVARLESGEIFILSNVGIFCVGVDIPFLANIIMARPTKSYTLYIQQAGRGTRPCSERGKQYFRILDHSANVLNHGFITNEPEANLEAPDKKKKKKIIDVKICELCFAAYMGPTCTICGHGKSVHSRPREFMHIDGKLVEITDEPFEAKVNRFIKEKKKQAKDRGYKRGWVFYQLQDKFGPEIADKFMPKRVVPSWIEINRI